MPSRLGVAEQRSPLSAVLSRSISAGTIPAPLPLVPLVGWLTTVPAGRFTEPVLVWIVNGLVSVMPVRKILKMSTRPEAGVLRLTGVLHFCGPLVGALGIGTPYSEQSSTPSSGFSTLFC